MTNSEVQLIDILGILAGTWLVIKAAAWLIQHPGLACFIATILIAVSTEMLHLAYNSPGYNVTLSGQLLRCAYFIFFYWGCIILLKVGVDVWKSKHQSKPPRKAV